MKKTTIMVVEDEFIVAQDIVSNLAEMGYDVCSHIDTGEEAVKKAEEKRPDLILMDIMLKGALDGVQAAERIHAQFRIPVIFLTAFANPPLLERAKSAEPFGYLIKPFSKRDLHSAIEVALNKAAMENRLRESEQRFREMAALLPTAICEFNADQRITFVNQAGLEMFGLADTDAADGADFMRFVHPAEREKASKRFAQALQGIAIGVRQYRLLKSDGSELCAVINSAPIRIDGRTVGVRTSIMDISELEKLRLRLRQAWKMESIATLAGGIAHEFNNALMGIMGNVDLMRLEPALAGAAKKYLDGMTTAAERMSQLTNQLLAYARGGRYYAAPTSLERFINAALPILRHSIPSGVETITEIETVGAEVRIDVTQFQMLLSAILTNAADAIDGRGQIRIQTCAAQVDEKSAGQYEGLQTGRYACLRIADNGHGMDEATRQKIFEPFFSTKFHGRGLNMAAVYGIVKNHGGWIGVESELNRGTVVTIYLPLYDRSNQERHSSSPPSTPAAGR
jgi:two-component system, cell cycle sensor histidine kinase and response regulator CckA